LLAISWLIFSSSPLTCFSILVYNYLTSFEVFKSDYIYVSSLVFSPSAFLRDFSAFSLAADAALMVFSAYFSAAISFYKVTSSYAVLASAFYLPSLDSFISLSSCSNAFARSPFSFKTLSSFFLDSDSNEA